MKRAPNHLERMVHQVSSPTISPPGVTDENHLLYEVRNRVLWLSTAMIHHANRVRPNESGVKVGGHQASSASMASIMTTLWFRHLRPEDRVSVKPHASPVLHAINHLLGELDAAYLTRLRDFGGLQSYPSRTKDPDPVDYSTGSVGIGATAPIWGAISRRYVDGLTGGAGTGRQYSLLGDAELDEGAVWEAVLDPAVAELGELVWVVDLNRQSLDRVVPDIAADKLRGMFNAAGWQVITLKYGRLLQELFSRPGGDELRHRIDTMPNPEYQRLLRCGASELRRRLPGTGPDSGRIADLAAQLDDEELLAAIADLAGHDLDALDEAFSTIDDSRPTVIFAYTIKGHGLATQGHPQNHSALLTAEQMRDMAARVGADPADPWRPFPDGSPAQALCLRTAQRLHRLESPRLAPPDLPVDMGRTPSFDLGDDHRILTRHDLPDPRHSGGRGYRPDGDGHPSAGTRHAAQFPQGFPGPSDVVENEVADHSIELVVSERQAGESSKPHVSFWGCLRGTGDHARLGIHRRHLRTPLTRSCGARACPHIEDPCTQSLAKHHQRDNNPRCRR